MMRHLDSAVRPAIAATLVAIALRVSGVLTMSNLDAISFKTSWQFGFLPNFALLAPPHVAADIATKATVIMLVGTILRLLPHALKRSAGPAVLGRTVGVVVAIETLGLSAYLHTRQPPVLAGDLVGIAVALSVVGIVVAAVALTRAEWPVPLHLMVRTVVSPPRVAPVEEAPAEKPAATLDPAPGSGEEPEAGHARAELPASPLDAPSPPADRPEPDDGAEDARAADLVTEMWRLWPIDEPELVGEDEPVIDHTANVEVHALVSVGEESASDTDDLAPDHEPYPDGVEVQIDDQDDTVDLREATSVGDDVTGNRSGHPVAEETAADGRALLEPRPREDDGELQLDIRDEDEHVDGIRVDLNVADADELIVLPGIGPSLAAMIVTFRQHAGGFESVEDLTAIAGIGPKTLARLGDRVVVDHGTD
jgi:competence ComEA-like helix-hairpin-helix protein